MPTVAIERAKAYIQQFRKRFNLFHPTGNEPIHSEPSDNTEHVKPRDEFIPVRPASLIEIYGQPIEAEEDGMNLAQSMVYPFIVHPQGQEDQPTGYMALIGHVLKGSQVLHFLNRFARFKRNVIEDPDGWMRNVVIDWAFMISNQTIDEPFRKELEERHNPIDVPGFDEFIPHTEVFIDALDDSEACMIYPTSRIGRVIVPLIYVLINGADRDFRVDVLEPDEDAQLRQAITSQLSLSDPAPFLAQKAVFDTFAGMAIPAYINPSVSNDWEERQFRQPMSIAQSPVQNYQHRMEHFRGAFMQRLEAHIFSAPKVL